jgi:hypothetical protein
MIRHVKSPVGPTPRVVATFVALVFHSLSEEVPVALPRLQNIRSTPSVERLLVLFNKFSGGDDEVL